MTNCKETYVPDGGRSPNFHACWNRASMPSGYCKTHDPDCIEARRVKRGPTQFERDIAAIKRRQKRSDALHAVARAAQAFIEADHNEAHLRGRLSASLGALAKIEGAL